MDVNESNTIYFVYVGKSLPSYGPASLKLAQKTSGSVIHLIGNQAMRKSVLRTGAKFTPIEDFYDPTSFLAASVNLSSEARFRDGFWVKSMERIFILEQFFQYKSLSTLFHAELDQLLFGTNRLISALNEISEKGLFVPFHSKEAVVASVLYVNDLSALQSLTHAAITGESFNNEMILLARWATSNPGRVFALPTLATQLKGSSTVLPADVVSISPTQIGGIVDAAQIGQWIGGIDPRNVPIKERPQTKFVDEPSSGLLSREDLESITLGISKNDNEVQVAHDGHLFQIYNLHLHSKSHRTILHKRPSLNVLFEESNQGAPTEIPGMRWFQLSTFISKVISIFVHNPSRFVSELNWRVKYKLNIRLTSHPFISGDTFRRISKFRWEQKSKNINMTEVKPGDIIFCESELFSELNECILSKSKSPIVLILGNSDKNHELLIADEFVSPTIAAIFAQNILDEIPKFEVLPIGLENLWRSKHGVLSPSKIKNAVDSQRKNRIMWGFNANTNPAVRNEAASALKRNPSADEIQNVTPKVHQSLLSEYAFVASPPGNGLDTHRTWEALYFRCVPIVLRSFMTTKYEMIGLPIWVIDSYSEIESLDEADLKEKYAQLKDKFSHEAIWADYWIERIQSISEEIKKNFDPSAYN